LLIVTAAISARRSTNTVFASIATAIFTVAVFAITFWVIARHILNIVNLNNITIIILLFI